MYGNRMKTITYKSNILDTVHRLRMEYERYHYNRPNIVYMNYETFELLEHECHAKQYRTERNYIFGMEIKIDESFSDFEIMVEREVTMRDHNLDAMRYLINTNPFRNNNIRKPQRYIINKGATVLFWEDGTKTIVKLSKDDEYNKRLGFLTAYFQKHSGMSKNQANKYLNNLIEE